MIVSKSSPRDIFDGSTPSTWVGSETLQVELDDNNNARVTLPEASNAELYHIKRNGITIATVFPNEITHYTDKNAVSGDVITVESQGSDGIITVNGPSTVFNPVYSERPRIISAVKVGDQLTVEWEHGTERQDWLYDVHVSEYEQPSVDGAFGNDLADSVGIGNVTSHTFTIEKTGNYIAYIRLIYSVDFSDSATNIADYRFFDYALPVVSATRPEIKSARVINDLLVIEWDHGTERQDWLYDVHLSEFPQPEDDSILRRELGDSVGIGNVTTHTFPLIKTGIYTGYIRARYFDSETDFTTIVADGYYADYEVEISYGMPKDGLTLMNMPAESSSFNSSDWQDLIAPLSTIFWEGAGDNYTSVTSQSGEDAMCVSLQPSASGSTRAGGGANVDPTQVFTLAQKIRLDKNFDWGGTNEGGKLGFGIAGGSRKTGGDASATDPDTQSGFSCRLMWRVNGQLEMYIYNADTIGYGTQISLGESAPRGQWFEIVMQVEMSSSKGAADGKLKVWISGEQVLNRSDMRWYGSTSSNPVQIDSLLHFTFHGGSDPTWSPSRNNEACFSNIYHGPVAIDGANIFTPSINTATGIFIDKASLDRSVVGHQAGLRNFWQDRCTASVSFSTAAELIGILSSQTPAIGGTKLVYTGSAAALVSGSYNSKTIINNSNSTKERPWVIVPQGGYHDKILRLHWISNTGVKHIYCEGWICDQMGGGEASWNHNDCGIMFASCLLKNWGNFGLKQSANVASSGHFSGLFNCICDFSNRQNTVNHSAIFTQQVSSLIHTQGTQTVVGVFAIYCDFINYGGEAEGSPIGSQGYDPTFDTILGGTRRFFRYFHCRIDGHTADNEALEIKSNDIQLYGCLLENSGSQFIARRSHDFFMHGCVNDQDGGIRGIKIHSDRAHVGWNAIINMGNGARCLETNVTDTNNNSNTVQSNYFAVRDAYIYNNIFHTNNVDQGMFMRLNGPITSEVAKPDNNTIEQNVFCNANGQLPFVSNELLSGKPPSITTQAQWDSNNPNGRAQDNVYLPSTAADRYEGTSFSYTLDPKPRALPWISHSDDPLTALDGTAWELTQDFRPSELFKSMIQVLT